MIRFPELNEKNTIGVTAPSSGLPEDLHHLLKEAVTKIEEKGYEVITGDTVWTQDKAKSSDAIKRAEELDKMLASDEIDIIIPPWGGELLVETLEHIDMNNIKPKWILGYSDLSTLLLAVTLKTGIATAHGTNLVDLRGEYSDETTAMWEKVLNTKSGGSVIQNSSNKYQKEWDHNNPSEYVFNLTEPTEWQTVNNEPVQASGRLLGGCIDVIRHLVGTPYGDVADFRNKYIPDEPVLWYLENFDLSTTELRRSLVQMKLAGWFENCSGIMFGRSAANQTVDNYLITDVYEELEKELNIPIIYDIDCGHVPPQMTFINGAHGEVDVSNGKGKLRQTFK
ncbi:S66 peptidase family protein [Salinicoccus sp. YB14-2]|uniref:S66 family peptidase n=1 Tax=Salinicoccus sp. YB14-2 TaxID=1572701 RepID=UPI00068F150C|nr:S66 peptidase family protein [Salinicoccus sp. YB14-2]